MAFEFRSDYLILSNENKPDASLLSDGFTCYEVDTGKLWLSYKGQWYDQDFE